MKSMLPVIKCDTEMPVIRIRIIWSTGSVAMTPVKSHQRQGLSRAESLRNKTASSSVVVAPILPPRLQVTPLAATEVVAIRKLYYYSSVNSFRT